MKKSVLVFFVVLVLLTAATLAMTVKVYRATGRSYGESVTWNTASVKEYAALVLAKGLKEEAAAAYECYLAETKDPANEVALISYRLGQLYMELLQYEKALGAFYRAEMLDPNASYKADMNTQVVAALENLGMSAQAQYELASRASVSQEPQSQGKPVARIGNETITETDIDRAIATMPSWMRKQFDAPDKRNQFIRQYVTQEVLYRKAKRLGLDATPDARETLVAMRKELAVQALLKREIGGKADVRADEIDLYYKANQKEFAEPAAVKVSWMAITDLAEKARASQDLTSGKGQAIDTWIPQGDTSIPGIEHAGSFIPALLTYTKGTVTEPFKLDNSWYLFLITDTRAERQKPLSEVKEYIEYTMTAKRQQEILNSLMAKVLEEQEVELFVPQEATSAPVTDAAATDQAVLDTDDAQDHTTPSTELTASGNEPRT